jgi:hypothetical protein
MKIIASGKNTEECLYNLWVIRQQFLRVPKAITIKENLDKLGAIKI